MKDSTKVVKEKGWKEDITLTIIQKKVLAVMWVTTKEWVPMMKNTKKLKYMGQGIQE